jgi:3-hydroxyisobutyrate dehydrogenase-like beta-hydroxyacid dehydrogenase
MMRVLAGQEGQQMAKISFLGLGVMGYPMAGHIAAAGHDVTVYNRTAAKAEAWVAQHGGAHAPSPAAAADGADVVLSCVGDDPDVLHVALGPEGAIPAMRSGALYIDNSTGVCRCCRAAGIGRSITRCGCSGRACVRWPGWR